MTDHLKELLEKTKPSYPPVVATEHGWADAKTGELLVAIKKLKSKLGETVVVVPVKPKRKRKRKPKPAA